MFHYFKLFQPIRDIDSEDSDCVLTLNTHSLLRQDNQQLTFYSLQYFLITKTLFVTSFHIFMVNKTKFSFITINPFATTK